MTLKASTATGTIQAVAHLPERQLRFLFYLFFLHFFILHLIVYNVTFFNV